MHLAWKEMKKNKLRFLIFGSIVFLVGFLTFVISGLANGLAKDNAALITELPDGTFYLKAAADGSMSASRLDATAQSALLSGRPDATALSIQMGFLHMGEGDQYGVAFVTQRGAALRTSVQRGEVAIGRSLEADGLRIGDRLTNEQLNRSLTVVAFVDDASFNHAPAAFVHPADYEAMYRTAAMQAVFVPGEPDSPPPGGFQALSNAEFLNAIPSYSAEQLSLSMIVSFLVVISGLLFAIFFYMMNVQKIGLYGTLKAIGVKTGALFRMMWAQMLALTGGALALAAAASQAFRAAVPDGLPFDLSPGSMARLSLAFLAIGFLGATLSGLQIRAIKPLQAMQQGEGL